MQGLVDGDEQKVLAEYVYTLQIAVSQSGLHLVGKISEFLPAQRQKMVEQACSHPEEYTSASKSIECLLVDRV